MPSADRAGHDGPGAQCLGDNVCGFTGGREATCDGELTVILNDGSTFLAVVLFELLIRLDDGDDTQLSGSGRTVHDFRGADGRQRAELVAVEHDTVVEAATVFVFHCQDLTVELLDQQGLVRQVPTNQRFPSAEIFKGTAPNPSIERSLK